MRNSIRAALGVAALTAAAATAPAPSAHAWEQCYAELGDGTAICLGSDQCEKVGQTLQKVVGDRFDCLYR